MRYLVAVLLFFQFGFTQEVNPTEAYKTVLRVKLNMDVNPVFYLDEPQSAQMNKVHQSCLEYLDLYDAKVSRQRLKTQAKIINQGAVKFSNIKYDQTIPTKVKKNIRYNYFSSKLGED